ncbi:uncharacterized protein N7483_001833 [Penicillium malachiteum]|uniref:uncharacterized protein n=1 Tax=Penicillium malachiteum TaxID=1324776 RepID=UPI0025496C28|nr:uncharacterized protein N7483_001833 [Penicillium malachiteum]KAJ5736708.1 hypothetical protein N7483_001833 [Penicillium malachiteum]
MMTHSDSEEDEISVTTSSSSNSQEKTGNSDKSEPSTKAPLGTRRTKPKTPRENSFTKLLKSKIPSFGHSYEPANLTVDEGEFHHKDHFQRVHRGRADERFLDPEDGRVEKLIVQCTNDFLKVARDSKYKRTSISNVSPLTLRIANWALRGFDADLEGKGYRSMNYLEAAVKWPAACLFLTIVSISLPSPPDGSPVPFSNIDRLLEPRYLLFDAGENESKLLKASDWKDWSKQEEKYRISLENVKTNLRSDQNCPEYVVVAYIGTQFKLKNEKDMAALNEIGLIAAREFGVPAYWISAFCTPGANSDSADDIYHISDIVRGARAVVIAVGPRKGLKLSDNNLDERIKTLVRDWGSRVWTLPEVLLCKNQEIPVYERGKFPLNEEGDPGHSASIPKSRFAEYAWDDSERSRQLTDHFSGSLILSPLQLSSIALNCLFSREKGDDFRGGHTYALMGLLLKRPCVDHNDSEFQAFARLSLANDSDKLLERLMCVLPQNDDQPWYCTDDKYDVNLWDIEPTCQIAGICYNDAILVDGAFGATIHWDKFRKVNSRRRTTPKRLITKILFHGAPFFGVIGIFTFVITFAIVQMLDRVQHDLSDTSFTAGVFSDFKHKVWMVRVWMYFTAVLGALLVVLAVLTFFCAPYLTRLLYGGKFWGSQAWLFGFEGYADLETIESQIFGGNLQRLRWSAYGSSLSRHEEASSDCEPCDPKKSSAEIAAKIEQAKSNTNPDGMRIFTLVDTNTMTVTLFEAVNPPSVVLLCAAEGGMQRAIACSYEWTTGTCYRETVLRMETPVLAKMSRVPRVKMGIRNTLRV